MSLRFHSVLASSGRETSPFSTVLRLPAGRSGRTLLRQSPAGLAIISLIAALILVPAANAQSCATGNALQASLITWSPPLDRRVSFHARDISLRDALDRVASA